MSLLSIKNSLTMSWSSWVSVLTYTSIGRLASGISAMQTNVFLSDLTGLLPAPGKRCGLMCAGSASPYVEKYLKNVPGSSYHIIEAWQRPDRTRELHAHAMDT